MPRKLRVLHVITRLELGGAQQNTLFCTAHHDRSRFEVELIAGRGGLLDEEALGIRDAGVRLVPYLVRPIAPLRDLLAVFRLRALFKSLRPDLVHTHSSKAGIIGRLAAFLAGVPRIVHTVHGWSFNATQPAWLRRAYVGLERLAAGITDRLIVVSAGNRLQGLAAGIGRSGQYTVLHSGIDPRRYRRPDRPRERVRESLGFEPGHVVVGTVGNFKPQKAPLDFVRAAAAAYAKDRRFRFFMAGDGILRPRVEAEIRRCGLEKVIRLLGWRRDVVDLYHAMDVFLLTSRFEGLPRSVLQAMAAGVPVVATAVDGTPEVVEHGSTGLLIPAGDPDAAAERLVGLVGDDALRRRCIEEARHRLDRRFDIHWMVEDLENLYLDLLCGPA